jgi:hypothetical protein
MSAEEEDTCWRFTMGDAVLAFTGLRCGGLETDRDDRGCAQDNLNSYQFRKPPRGVC